METVQEVLKYIATHSAALGAGAATGLILEYKLGLFKKLVSKIASIGDKIGTIDDGDK
jgi:hypothetical protein